jgi:hypothetical protein
MTATSSFHPMTSAQNISLYIPRLAYDSHKDSDIQTLGDFIAYKFKSLVIGVVRNVDFKKGFINKEGRIYYKAFVHFEFWYDNPTTRSLQHRILNPKEYANNCAKLVYEDPHFWMLFEYKPSRYKRDPFKLIEKLEKQLEQVQTIAAAFKAANDEIKKRQSAQQPGRKRSRIEYN